MIKQTISETGLGVLSAAGLVVFAAVFVGITLWAFTRSRRQVATWSSLPLRDGPDPVEPRGADRASAEGSRGESENGNR